MTSSKISLSIVIPNYNGAQFLETCLQSLIKSLTLVKIDYEIIIVDNASKDNSISKIENCEAKRSPPLAEKLKIIQNSINAGFAKAVNQGIKAAKFNYVVLCNNDLTVDKNYFSLLIDTIKNYPDYTTFVGTVLNKEGTHFESQGLKFYYSGKCENILNKKLITKSLINKKPYQIWGASAALVTYKKNVITKIGMFDESFFAYEEDVDLALRLHNLGYKTLLIPSALCYHLGGGTSGKMGNFREKQDFKNWIRLIHKNYSIKQKITHFLPILFNLSLYFLAIIKSTIKMVKYSHDYRN